MAIWTGSADDSLRVRLLSMPHATQAQAISAAPTSSAAAPCHDGSAAPTRIAKAPISKRRSTFSRNTSHAMLIVARPLRFSNNEALAASVPDSRNIRNSGPSTPPDTTTAASHGTSARRSGASGAGNRKKRRERCTSARPSPRAQIEQPRHHPRIDMVQQKSGQWRARAEHTADRRASKIPRGNHATMLAHHCD